MKEGAQILYPCFALVVLTAIVFFKMMWDRLSEFIVRRIDPQSAPTSAQLSQTLRNLKSADNYRNLFELPVLFYVLCLVGYLSGVDDSGLILGAWVFVGLRGLHSFIHCTYNNVRHRFYVFASGALVLFFLWSRLALDFLI